MKWKKVYPLAMSSGTSQELYSIQLLDPGNASDLLYPFGTDFCVRVLASGTVIGSPASETPLTRKASAGRRRPNVYKCRAPAQNFTFEPEQVRV